MWIVLLACIHGVVYAEISGGNDGGNVEKYTDRESRLSIFQVVKFANSECTGSSSKNGTCYTKAECENIGGSQSGTCADGFGVCCLVTITSGESASVNNTYISADSSITSGAHTYTICPCSDDICRIKFDFNTFTLNGPVTGAGTKTFGTATLTTATLANAQNIGQCHEDTFQIVSPSGRSSPLICGENANQHMILEACGSECLTVRMGISDSTSTSRALDIRVTQYRCGDEQGGPPGCLQYFENTTGKIRSFNFPDTTAGTAITYNYAFHLTNQHYKTCIRRGNGNEIICYTACTTDAGEDENAVAKIADDQGSFGLSASNAKQSMSIIDTSCSTDYIWIPFGYNSNQFTTAISAQDSPPEVERPSRFCGRYFQTNTATFASTSVCSYQTPFELGVDFDDDEVCTAITDTKTCESLISSASVGGGGGILGFSLCYVQYTPPSPN